MLPPEDDGEGGDVKKSHGNWLLPAKAKAQAKSKALIAPLSPLNCGLLKTFFVKKLAFFSTQEVYDPTIGLLSCVWGIAAAYEPASKLSIFLPSAGAGEGNCLCS